MSLTVFRAISFLILTFFRDCHRSSRVVLIRWSWAMHEWNTSACTWCLIDFNSVVILKRIFYMVNVALALIAAPFPPPYTISPTYPTNIFHPPSNNDLWLISRFAYFFYNLGVVEIVDMYKWRNMVYKLAVSFRKYICSLYCLPKFQQKYYACTLHTPGNNLSFLSPIGFDLV